MLFNNFALEQTCKTQMSRKIEFHTLFCEIPSDLQELKLAVRVAIFLNSFLNLFQLILIGIISNNNYLKAHRSRHQNRRMENKNQQSRKCRKNIKSEITPLHFCMGNKILKQFGLTMYFQMNISKFEAFQITYSTNLIYSANLALSGFLFSKLPIRLTKT